jgi:hypothetical protein
MQFFNDAPAPLVMRVVRHMHPDVACHLHAAGVLSLDDARLALGCAASREKPPEVRVTSTGVQSYDSFVAVGQRIAIAGGAAVRAPTTGLISNKRKADGAQWMIVPFSCPRASAVSLADAAQAKRTWLRKGMVRLTRDAFRSRVDVQSNRFSTAHSNMREKPPAISADPAVFPRVIDLPPGALDRFYASIATCAQAVWTAMEDKRVAEGIAKASYEQKDFWLHFNHGAESVVVNGREVRLPDNLKIRVPYVTHSTNDRPDVFFTRAIPLTEAEKACSWKRPRSQQPLGAVFGDGAAVFVHDAWLDLRDFIASWEADAVETANAIGRLCTSCLMCGRMLSQRSSVQRGVGPECAKEWRFIAGPLFDARADAVVQLAPIQPVGPSVAVPTSTGGSAQVPRALIEHSPVLRAAADLDDDLATLVFPAHLVTDQALLDLDRMARDTGGHADRARDAAWFPHDPRALEAAMLAADFLGLPDATVDLLVGRYVQRVFSVADL